MSEGSVVSHSHEGSAAYLRLSECALCPLNEGREKAGRICPSYIPEKWAPGGLLFIGEGPGHNEMVRQEPFIGKAGELLTALCNAAGVARDTVAILNATSCLPANDPKIKDTQLEIAVPSCRPRLVAEVTALKPRVIVALGNAALTALTGKWITKVIRVPLDCSLCGDGKRPKTCTECRGLKTKPEEKRLWIKTHTISHVAGAVFPVADMGDHWLKDAGVTYVIPTFHPSYLLRGGKTTGGAVFGGQYSAPDVVAHLKKAKSLLSRDVRFDVKPVLITEKEIQTFQEYVKDTALPFAVDIETDALEAHNVTRIKCVGIGRADRAETLVLITDGLPKENPLVVELAKFLTDKTKPKIFQNRAYDEVVFDTFHWRILVRGTVGDTMLGSHALYPDEKHDLHAIGFRYTDSPPWKPAKHGFESDAELWEYNARDTRVTALAWEPMLQEMREEKVDRVHETDMIMSDVAMDMTQAGLPISKERLLELGSRMRKQSDAAIDELRRLIGKLPNSMHTIDYGDQFNPNSQAHCQWALFDATGPARLNVIKQTAKGAPSTESEVLRVLVHPIADELLRYREAVKVASTYAEGYLKHIAPDGRIHPSWDVRGARTGRWSSSPNLQNAPKEIRDIFVAPTGYKIVGADFAQLEARILAALAGDVDMITRLANADEKQKLNPDRDPHSFVARLAFGSLFMDGDPKVKSGLRDASKRVLYGLNYGAQAPTLLSTIMTDPLYRGPRLTLDIVQRIMRAIMTGYAGIGVYQAKALKKATQTREVRSAILGRRRVFPLGQVEATIALNYPIQSTAADIMNLSLARLYRRLSKDFPKAMPIAQVHDAIYVECPENQAEKIGAIIEEEFFQEYVFVDGAPKMPFTAASKIGVDMLEAA